MENDNTPEFELDENQNETDQNPESDKQHDDGQDEKDWKAEALKLKAILDRNKNKKAETPNYSKKSDDFDYGQKAFLIANGIKGSKEEDFVKKELKSSGQSLDSLIENDYFKQRLTEYRTINTASEAIPKGDRSSSPASGTLEYWLTQDFKDVPTDMRAAVVNARMKSESSKGTFYNS